MTPLRNFIALFLVLVTMAIGGPERLSAVGATPGLPDPGGLEASEAPCLQDINGNGVGDVLDVLATAARPECFTYLPLAESQEAAEAFAEGIRLLMPFFQQLPQAFAALIQTLSHGYLQACKAAGCEVDAALLRDLPGLGDLEGLDDEKL